MPKKQNKLNPFGMFLQSKSQEWRCSMKEATQRASALWNQMSTQEKAKYGVKNEDKYTTTGEKLTVIENKIKLEYKEKENEIASLDILYDLPIEVILNKCFHVMAINTYCKTELYTCFSEMSIVQFNLQDGCQKIENIILGFENIRLGYDNEVKNGARECGIAPPPLKESSKDPINILQKIKNLIQNIDGEYSPIFTNQDKMVKLLLHKLCEVTGENKHKFSVFSLTELFIRLRNTCVTQDADKYPGASIPEALLQRQTNIYELSIACDYHKKEEDTYMKCASSNVIDSIYTICEHCCLYRKIPMKSGRHKP